MPHDPRLGPVARRLLDARSAKPARWVVTVPADADRTALLAQLASLGAEKISEPPGKRCVYFTLTPGKAQQVLIEGVEHLDVT